MFLRLNDSDAAAKTPISVTRAAFARASPARLGTSAAYRVPGLREMPANTSDASAICGTHFGLTNADTSMTGSPAALSRSMNAILSAVETGGPSFCRPSRGPTSTKLTRLGYFMRSIVNGCVPVGPTLRVGRAGNHLVADCADDGCR